MNQLRLIVIFSLGLIDFEVNAEKLKLLIVLYNETHAQRMQEYKTCLERNLNHSSIDAIHVIYDTTKDSTNCQLLSYLKSKNVTISYYQGRPSFAYCFRKANNLYPESKVILSNADIYFNDTLKVLEDYNLHGKFLAITRKNVEFDGKLTEFPGAYRGKAEPSQDVWVFKTPMVIFPREDILIGLVHCEGEIAYAARSGGLDVIDPYYSIDCCHLHLSHVRHWIDRPYPNKPIYLPQLCELPKVSQ